MATDPLQNLATPVPFQDFLQPQTIQPPQQQLSGYGGKTAGLLNVASNFLAGVSKGRSISYARSEQQKSNQERSILTAIQTINSSSLPDPVKQAQTAPLMKALGSITLGILGSGDGTKNKSKKGDDASGSGDQQPHPAHHILTAIKGMVSQAMGPGAEKLVYTPQQIQELTNHAYATVQDYHNSVQSKVTDSDQRLQSVYSDLTAKNGGNPPTRLQLLQSGDWREAVGSGQAINNGQPTPFMLQVESQLQQTDKQNDPEYKAKIEEQKSLTGQHNAETDLAKARTDQIRTGPPTKFTGEMAERMQALKVKTDPKSSPDEKAQADALLRSYDLKRQATIVRIENGKQTAEGAKGDAKEIARSIVDGEQPPDLKGLYRMQAPVRAELSRMGYNLAGAERDWTATQQHLRTLNGQQQTRVMEALTSLDSMLPAVQDAFDQWKATGLPTGFKAYNGAALRAAAALPGEKGVAAQNLLTYINDTVSETGYIYMGGNSPTDHALRLAEQNLSGDWNEEQFKNAIGILKKNLDIRRNSIINSPIIGASQGSTYLPGNEAGTATTPGAQPQPPTATAPPPTSKRTASPPQGQSNLSPAAKQYLQSVGH